MTKKVTIKNFKSVKELSFDSNKINIFIGEPNSGKSNILEALSFFSPGSLERNVFNEIFRFKTIGDFFYDNNFNDPIRVSTDSLSVDISLYKNESGSAINQFEMAYSDSGSTDSDKSKVYFNFQGQQTGIVGKVFDSSFRTYIFKRLNAFSTSFRPFLSTPFGDNLPGMLLGNNHLKKIVSDFFKEKGFRIQLKPVENDISISKEIDDEIYSYPFTTISETLQRIVFMMIALESNTKASIILDEPESNTFPFYTKYIAERIALDQTNQFFITTHNPYLLMSIIEKAKIHQLNIFICQLQKYETKLSLLNEAQLEKALDMGPDIFFNLERIVNS